MSETAVPARQAAFGFILASVLLDSLSLGLIFPVLPALVKTLAHGDAAAAARAFGWIAGGWSLMNFFGAPILGALSDRFGRRPVILISIFGFVLDLGIMALAPSLAWLFVGRLLSGLTAASAASSFAYVSDITSAEHRARRFGLMAALSGAGLVLGPAMGGLLGELSPRAPFWAAMVFAAAGGLYGLVYLPESLPPERRARINLAAMNPARAAGLLARDRVLAGLASVTFAMNLAGHAANTVFVLYTGHRYGWGSREVGLLLMAYAAGTIAVMGGLGPLAVSRLGERRTILAGVACGVLGFVGLGLAPTGVWFCLAVLPALLTNLAGPALSALQSRRVQATEYGRLQGAMGSLNALGGLAGPVIFAQVFAWSVGPGLPAAWSGAALLAGAAAMALGGLLALAFARISPEPPRT